MHAKPESLPVLVERGATSLRGTEWGDSIALFYAVAAGTDMRPLMKGLPNDLCPCPHWGFVLKGRLRVVHADHDEVVMPGEMFYVEPGHAPCFDEDTEMIEFSPKAPWLSLMETVGKNLAALPALDHHDMLAVALEEAKRGLAEGGVPIGAALFGPDGRLLGRGHNRRVQDGDPSLHAETDAFRRAGRRRSYRDTVMVTTLAPCWYCSGLVVQFGIGTVVVGESRTFRGGVDWLRERGVDVVDLDSPACRELLRRFVAEHSDVWNEDIGLA